MQNSFSLDDVRIARSSLSYNGFFKIRKLELQHRLFAGGWSESLTRELFDRGESVAAILYDQVKDCIIMIEQFRIGAIGEKSPWLLEIVAGMVEEGEEPKDVVTRETMEEAGCEIQTLIKVFRYLPSPGGSSEVIHLFCGLVDSEGVGGVYGKADEGEDIRVKTVPFAEAYMLMTTGVICNAASIIALQWLKLNRNKLKKARV